MRMFAGGGLGALVVAVAVVVGALLLESTNPTTRVYVVADVSRHADVQSLRAHGVIPTVARPGA
jgi:hypothetical protein